MGRPKTGKRKFWYTEIARRIDGRSEKHLASVRKYFKSLKGKATMKRYAQSEKGKAARKRWYEKHKRLKEK